VETSGSIVLFEPRILKGCQSSATSPGAMGDFGLRSGGIASLNPRLLSGKPPACSLAAPKTNTAASLGGGWSLRLIFLAPCPAAQAGHPGPRRTKAFLGTDFTDNSDAFYPCHP
jgi:hypothetical protein